MTKRLRFLLSIFIGGSCIIALMLLQTLLSENHSYWNKFYLLVIIHGIVFGGWAIFIEYNKFKKERGNNEGTPRFLFYKTLLGVMFWTFPICCIASCDNYNRINEVIDNSTQSTVWNANTISLPHLTDVNQYVSNPDSLLNKNAQDSLNHILQNLDKKLGVESAVVVVRHVENADVFRMAQEIGNNIGVGHRETNRGLVMVVAYDDHKYFIAPGIGLEEDLTDAKCSQLARQYLMPNMKKGNLNGAMLQFISALYNLLKGEEQPRVTSNFDEMQYIESIDIGEDCITFIIILFWLILYAWLNDKYKWVIFQNNDTGYIGFGRDRTVGAIHSYWGTMWYGNSSQGGWNSNRGYGGGSFGGGGAGGSW